MGKRLRHRSRRNRRLSKREVKRVTDSVMTEIWRGGGVAQVGDVVQTEGRTFIKYEVGSDKAAEGRAFVYARHIKPKAEIEKMLRPKKSFFGRVLGWLRGAR